LDVPPTSQVGYSVWISTALPTNENWAATIQKGSFRTSGGRSYAYALAPQRLAIGCRDVPVVPYEPSQLHRPSARGASSAGLFAIHQSHHFPGTGKPFV